MRSFLKSLVLVLFWAIPAMAAPDLDDLLQEVQATVGPGNPPTMASDELAREGSHVALMLPLSGAHQSLGHRLLGAILLAFFETHAPLTLDIYDTQGSAHGAREALDKMLRQPQRAQFILGPLTSAEVKAVARTAQTHHIPILTLSNDETIASPNVYVFGISPRQQVLMARPFFKAQGFHHILLVVRKDAHGKTFKREVASHLGPEFVVHVIELEPGSPMVSPDQLKGMADKNIQVVWAPGFERDIVPLSSSILRALPPTARPVRFFSADDWYHHDYLNHPPLRGSWFLGPDPDRRRAFLDLYGTHFSQAPVFLEMLAYDAATTLFRALSQSPNDARAVLLSHEGFKTLTGRIIWDTQGKLTRFPHIIEVAAPGMVSAYGSFGE